MKLKNKKTGEIKDLLWVINHLENDKDTFTLAELNEEWEDAPEEPKEYWCIDWTGGVNHITLLDDSTDKYEKAKKQIGNYFETKEEAEKAVEKLRAWKRLRDKGFRFCGHNSTADGTHAIEYIFDDDIPVEPLDLLFGGEE